MKLFICIVFLFSGCMYNMKSLKKPNNIIPRENLQEKFEEIDLNKDGVIDKIEIREYEKDMPPHSDPKTPAIALFQILGFVLLLCILPKSLSLITGKVRAIRDKKRVQ